MPPYGVGAPEEDERFEGGKQRDLTTVVRMILLGGRTAVTDKRPTPSSMPSYAWKLDDDEVAAVATCVRNAWGNSASAVTPDEVGELA